MTALPDNGEKNDLPHVTILTLNWNRRDDTAECLQSLAMLDYPDFEIALVDNGSTDGSVSFLLERFPHITILENQENLGYAAGMNRGIEYALRNNSPYVLILNNDTIIDRNALRELVTVAESDQRIGFVSGKVYYFHERNTLQEVGKEVDLLRATATNIGQGEKDTGQYDTLRDYQFLDDVFWLVRTEVFRNIGMYDPVFFLHFEETDLCARANTRYRLVYTPKAKIWHKVSQSSGGAGSPLVSYYLARNQIIFSWKHLPGVPYFLLFLMYFLLIATPQRIGGHLIHRRRRNTLSHVQGIIAGLRWVISGP
jgi:GT2 family glycosyltransferase